MRVNLPGLPGVGTVTVHCTALPYIHSPTHEAVFFTSSTTNMGRDNHLLSSTAQLSFLFEYVLLYVIAAPLFFFFNNLLSPKGGPTCLVRYAVKM
jgi:hypothetical protein